MSVDLPTNCTHQRLLGAIHEADVVDSRDQEILVRAEPGAFVHSSAIALLCCWGLLRIQNGCRFRFVGDPETLRYLARMDLLRLLAAPYEENFTRRDEEGRFIALRLVEDREQSLRAGLDAIVGLVEAQHEGAGAFLPALRWAVAEVLDNVGNHSESPVPGVLCGQFYPRRQRMDVAVCDMGRGIKASLQTRFPRLYSHGDAVTKAVQAGVTRDLDVGQGNGLAGCIEIIAANGGNLHLWTGDVDFAYVQGKKRGFEKIAGLPGTGVLLQLRTERPVDLRSTTIGGGAEVTLQDVSRVAEPGETRLVVAELCAHTEGRSPARELRERALAPIRDPAAKNHSVVLDFRDVKSATSSFLDELLGRLAAELGAERYRSDVTVAGMSDLLRGMANKVVQQRLATSTPDGAIEASRDGAKAHRSRALERLAPFDLLVQVGSDPLVDGLCSTWDDSDGVEVKRVHLEGDWRAALCKIRDASNSRRVLLLPAFESAGARQAGSAGRAGGGFLAEDVIQAWVGDCPAIAACTALVPRMLMASARSGAVRQLLWQLDCVRSTVEFDNHGQLIPRLHPGFALSLVELGSLREREDPHSLCFLDGAAILASDLKDAQRQKAIEKLKSPFGKVGEFGFRAVWQSDDDPLTADWHDPQLAEAADTLEGKGGTVPLAELLDQLHLGVNRAALGLKPADSGELRLITGRDLASGLAALRLEDLQCFAGSVAEQPLSGGEILVSRIFRGPVRVDVVHEALVGAHAASSIMVLKPKDEPSRQLLVDYLSSDLATRWLRVRSGGAQDVTNLSVATIQQLPVPSLDNDLVQLARSLRGASDSIASFRQRFDEARRAVFSIDNLRERLTAMQETAAQARLFEQFAESIDDMAATIRRTLPLPLAEAWRSLEAEGDDRRRYAAGIELFESAMVFVAVMLLADVRREAHRMSRVVDLLECFRTPERGPALGQWIEVQQQCPKLTWEQSLEQSAFPELRMLVAQSDDSPYFAALSKLKQRRNDLAHGRGPTTELEVREGVASNQADLEVLFGALLFLARYPLRLVEEADYDELDGRRTISYRDLVGDHPIVPRRKDSVTDEVGRGLYLVDQRGSMRLISPWLIYEECPECGHREVCAPEFGAPKRDADAGVYYKSLTTGHMHPGRASDWSRLAKFVGRDAVKEDME